MSYVNADGVGQVTLSDKDRELIKGIFSLGFFIVLMVLVLVCCCGLIALVIFFLCRRSEGHYYNNPLVVEKKDAVEPQPQVLGV